MTLLEVYAHYKREQIKKRSGPARVRVTDVYQLIADDAGVHWRTVYRWYERGAIPPQYQAKLNVETKGALKIR